MKLWILRHAKAEADSASGRDQDRALSAAGQAHCANLEKWLAAQAPVPPSLVLVSPARRTLETARMALPQSGWPEISVERTLWLASAGELLALVEQTMTVQQPAGMMLIAHNPGLEDLVGLLGGRLPAPGMKPGTLVIAELNGSIGPGCAEIECVVQPSDLR